MTTPNAMPMKQPHPIHQQILGGLLLNKQHPRKEIRGKRDKNGVWTESTIEVPTPGLAGNVSELNVGLAAQRWIA